MQVSKFTPGFRIITAIEERSILVQRAQKAVTVRLSTINTTGGYHE